MPPTEIYINMCPCFMIGHLYHDMCIQTTYLNLYLIPTILVDVLVDAFE